MDAAPAAMLRRAFDEAQVIEPGSRVEIVKIEGATALVYE